MVVFEDIQDVEEWLAPLDYSGFWNAVAPWSLFTEEDRGRFEHLIETGEVRADTILVGIKIMATNDLTRRFGLHDRTYEPPDAKYLRQRH